MDIDEIHDALHEISMMVTVLLSAQEDMVVPETNPSVFQIPRAAGEMLSFGSYDLDKRVKDLRDKLNLPTGTGLRDRRGQRMRLIRAVIALYRLRRARVVAGQAFLNFPRLTSDQSRATSTRLGADRAVADAIQRRLFRADGSRWRAFLISRNFRIGLDEVSGGR
jgi:hypothetical protein